MTTKTIPPLELPDAVTNTVTPRDQHGELIQHGKCYYVAKIGVVKVHYEVELDEFFFYWPASPEKSQPVSMLPEQTEPWILHDN